jgi:uncharacterized protein (TIGR03435 family)
MRLRRWIVCSLLFYFISVPSASPQTSPAIKPSFEVASIKVNIRDVPWLDTRENCGFNGMGSVNILPGGRLKAERALLPCIVAGAYSFQPFQVLGGPDWANSVHYDIDAKPGNTNTDQQQIRVMVQALLADRFKLKTHRETRNLPVYVLTVAKNGPKLQPPKGGNCFEPGSPRPSGATAPPTPPPAGQPPPPLVVPCGKVGIVQAPGGSRLDGEKAPISDLIRLLTILLHRTVRDKTGATGIFDIHVVYSSPLMGRDQAPAGPPLDGATDPGVTMFSAMEQQLGLKLESAKGPVEVLIIDHAEKPSEN